MSASEPPDRPRDGPSDDRFESWKEIAAYLRRDVKTVQRWERREGLPVRRHLHDKQASVFAFKAELDAWRHRRGPQPNGFEDGEPDSADGPPAETEAGRTVVESHAEQRAIESGALGRRARRLRRFAAAAAGIVLVGAAVAIAALVRGRPIDRPGGAVARFSIPPPPDTMFAGNMESPAPALSPDGTRFVFRAAHRETGRQLLYLRSLDKPDPVAIDGTDGAVEPFWSPDGTHIGFVVDGRLKTINLLTGWVESLADCPNLAGAAWRHSEIVFSPEPGSPLFSVPAGGGTPRPFTTLNAPAGEIRHGYPQVLPDGSVIFFVDHRDAERHGVAAVRKRGDIHRWVVSSDKMMTFAAPGHLVWFQAGALMALAFDHRSLSVAGPAVRLGERIEPDRSGEHGPEVSASGGHLVFWDPRGTYASQLTWFDRHGTEIGRIGAPGNFPAISLSPDGRSVAVQRTLGVGVPPDVWVFDLADAKATRLTASAANDEDPVWAPDSSRLAYAAHRGMRQRAALHTIQVARPREDGLLHADERGVHPTDWSKDGRWIVFQGLGRATKSDVLMVPASGGAPRTLVGSEFDEMHGRLSPDGRTVAYTSDKTGRREVYVQGLAPDAVVWQVSNGGGAHPRWRADGRELFYLSAQGHIVCVPIGDADGSRPGVPTPLFDARPPLPLAFSDAIYDVTPDGSRFLVAANRHIDSRPITLVLNWRAIVPR